MIKHNIIQINVSVRAQDVDGNPIDAEAVAKRMVEGLTKDWECSEIDYEIFPDEGRS